MADETKGTDIFGNPTGKDIFGNAGDTNILGERPEDAQGKPPLDIFGNETGS